MERLGDRDHILNLSTYPSEIVIPLSDLRFSLDLFEDRSAIVAHQTLIQTSKPLGDHALLMPTGVVIQSGLLPLTSPKGSNGTRSVLSFSTSSPGRSQERDFPLS